MAAEIEVGRLVKRWRRDRRAVLTCVVTIVVLAGLPLSVVAAGVFKCVEGGRTIYQDQPCAPTGAVLNLSQITAKEAAEAEAELARLRRSVAAPQHERERRQAEAEIERLDREIQNLEQDERTELAALQALKNYMNYNYAAAPWERAWAQQAVSKQMQSVSEQYAASKRALRSRIARLQEGIVALARG